MSYAFSERLTELVAKLPKGLRSDWEGTNHFELTSAEEGDYWWLVFDEVEYARENTEIGQRFGTLLDIAEELVRIRDEGEKP